MCATCLQTHRAFNRKVECMGVLGFCVVSLHSDVFREWNLYAPCAR